MKTSPKVSVLMPVYNCQDYIIESIDSILNQTFTDFEFIIIDDASSDKTVEKVKEIKDSRINLILKPKNTGYTNSLNYGLKIAKGSYIARMDADDISMPKRFAEQVSFLDLNESIVACGSVFKIINEETIVALPEKDKDIKLAMLAGNAMAHPSIMMRASILRENNVLYNTNTEPAEDFDLWVVLMKYGKLHNLQTVLLNYRIHDNQVSSVKRLQQNESAIKTRIKLLKYVHKDMSKDDEDILTKIYKEVKLKFSDIEQYIHIKKHVINNNSFFNADGLVKYFDKLDRKILEKYLMTRNTFSLRFFSEYLKIKKNFSYKIPVKTEMKLFVKSIISYKYK